MEYCMICYKDMKKISSSVSVQWINVLYATNVELISLGNDPHQCMVIYYSFLIFTSAFNEDKDVYLCFN
jgi:hypothetical protein